MTMNLNEFLAEQDAAGRLALMFREGLNDTVHLPEVHSESATATHALMGCAWYMAMFMLTGMVTDLADDTPPPVRRILEAIVEEKLAQLAATVVARRGPLGPDECGGR